MNNSIIKSQLNIENGNWFLGDDAVSLGAGAQSFLISLSEKSNMSYGLVWATDAGMQEIYEV